MSQTLGDKIRYHRKRIGLTQEELAARMQVSPQTVNDWENDRSSPDLSALPRLAAILGTSTDELLSDREPVHEAEIVGEKKHFAPTRWDGIIFALYVFCCGALMLVNQLLLKEYDVSHWTVIWTLALTFFGLFCQKKGRFSMLGLGVTLAGLYFLLSHYSPLRLPLTWGVVLPIVFVLWGVSLLVDVFRRRREK